MVRRESRVDPRRDQESGVMPLPKIGPLELIQQRSPFDHDDWLFEIKHDGFRAVAYVEDGICALVSRNNYNFKRFADLSLELPSDLKAKNAIVDGELSVLDDDGKARFYELMAGRGTAIF